jgi:hypothetical protein
MDQPTFSTVCALYTDVPTERTALQCAVSAAVGERMGTHRGITWVGDAE